MYNNKLFISSFFFASLVLFSACGGTNSDSGTKPAATSTSQTSTENTSGSKNSIKVTAESVVTPVDDTVIKEPTVIKNPIVASVVVPADDTMIKEPIVESVVSPVVAPIEDTIVDGVTFVDASTVGGIDYKCGAKEGTSNSLGVMDCQASSISFFLGNLTLGTVSKVYKDKIVYTTELLDQPRGATLYPDVSKVSMLLQSLDKDGDISNGIVIDKSVLFITNQHFSTYTKLSEISSKEFSNIVKEIVIKIHENNPATSITFVNLKDAQDNLTARIATPLK